MGVSSHFNKLYREFIRKTYRYCSIYDERMNQITQWVPIALPGGRVDFGIAPFDFYAYYYATWDGNNISTLNFNRIDIPSIIKAKDSILITLSPSVNGENVFRDDDWMAY